MGRRQWRRKERSTGSEEVTTTECIFVCCLHLLGIISRQKPQPQDVGENGSECVKEECKVVRKLMRRTVNLKRKEGIRKYERRTQVGLSIIF